MALPTQIDETSLTRSMGLRPGSPSARRLAKALPEVLPIAAELIEVKGLSHLDANDRQEFPGRLASVSHLVYCVVTAGKPISTKIQEMNVAGQVFPAMVLDAVTNATINSYSDQMWLDTRAAANEGGMNITRRYTPGCPHLDLSYQHVIMKRLPQAADLGISLSPSGVMNPEKSLIYIYGADARLRADAPENFCGTCREQGCLKRRHD